MQRRACQQYTAGKTEFKFNKKTARLKNPFTIAIHILINAHRTKPHSGQSNLVNDTVNSSLYLKVVTNEK
jgi:hypothetical protein